AGVVLENEVYTQAAVSINATIQTPTGPTISLVEIGDAHGRVPGETLRPGDPLGLVEVWNDRRSRIDVGQRPLGNGTIRHSMWHSHRRRCCGRPASSDRSALGRDPSTATRPEA